MEKRTEQEEKEIVLKFILQVNTLKEWVVDESISYDATKGRDYVVAESIKINSCQRYYTIYTGSGCYDKHETWIKLFAVSFDTEEGRQISDHIQKIIKKKKEDAIDAIHRFVI